MTIKPSSIQQEGFFSHKVSHLLETVKEKTTDYVDKVKVKQQNINSFATTTNVQQKGNNISQQEQGQPQFVIPVIEERYTVSKKPVLEDVKIEKRWITHNEKIQLDVSYENCLLMIKILILIQKKIFLLILRISFQILYISKEMMVKKIKLKMREWRI